VARVIAYSTRRVARLRERHDQLGNLEPMDEVVEHGLQRRVLHEVGAVVHHEQR